MMRANIFIRWHFPVCKHKKLERLLDWFSKPPYTTAYENRSLLLIFILLGTGSLVLFMDDLPVTAPRWDLDLFPCINHLSAAAHKQKKITFERLFTYFGMKHTRSNSLLLRNLRFALRRDDVNFVHLIPHTDFSRFGYTQRRMILLKQPTNFVLFVRINCQTLRIYAAYNFWTVQQ